MDSSVERLHEAIDELAAVDLRFGSVGEELLALERARARLDARSRSSIARVRPLV